MNIAESMKSLTEQIIVSHDMRVKALGDLVIDTKKTLQDFHKDHQHMSSKQAKDLAKGESDRLKDFKAMMGDIQKYVSGIVSDTKKLLSEYSSDMMKTSNIWNGMSKTMAKARKAGAVAPKAEAKARPVVEAEAIKEAAKEVEKEEVSPEMDLEEKILGFIKSHREGVKVGDMETALGATRMRLGMVAKKLLDEGKVRKEENQYFPL